MRIAVASGKGGTGKTTLSVNLAKVMDAAVQVADCDVEEPNAHLFLKGTGIKTEAVTIPVPEVDESRCDGCGECGRFCQFHAIIALQTKPLVFPDMCHGCGGCAKVCPQTAIREVNKTIGVVETLRAGNITLVQGRLNVGAPMAPPVIRAVKARLDDGLPAILDAPPGTSCPVIATLRGADYVVLVTEPTPFGLHDLTLAVDMAEAIRIPYGIVINRVGSGDDRVHRFCRSRDIPILAEIPDDRRIAEAVSRGRLVVEALPEYRRVFRRLLDRVAGLRRTFQEAAHADV
jgi:MinD superfamily P-loop ATPase